MTSLIERDTSTAIPPEELERHREVARATFRELPEDIKKGLISAASTSRMVWERINDGRWLSAVRALRGLSLTHGQDAYAVLGDAFEKYIPHLLEK